MILQYYDIDNHDRILFPIKTLSQFIKYYPKLFSQKDFPSWRKLFDDHATMIKIKSNKLDSFTSIDEAIHEQIEYGKENRTFIEEWKEIETHDYGNIAIVKANYKLTVDTEIREGIDVITLFQDQKGWHIVNLVYEETKYIKYTKKLK